MFTRSFRALIAAAAIFAGATTAQAATVEAVEFLNKPMTDAGSPLFTSGYSFTANTNLRVTALGNYDRDGDGMQGQTEVGLFSAAGELLRMVAFNGLAGTLHGIHRYVDLADAFTLVAGQTYVLGSWSLDPHYNFNSNYWSGIGTPLKWQENGITLIENRWAADLSGMNGIRFPNRQPAANFAHKGSFAPNMLIEVAPIPLPAGGFLLIGGIGALAALRRRNRA